MAGHLKQTRPTRRDAADAVRLKHAGDPAHINADEARLLARLMPEAAGPVLTRGLLAEAGRRGDDRVTRLIPAEAALLKRSGGAGTRNPLSGLLEYYGGDISGNEGNDSLGSGGMSGDSKAGDTMSGENSGGGDFFGIGRPRTPAVESLLAAPNFTMPGVEITQYAPPDTWGRVVQELLNPHPAKVRATPGRYGAPTVAGPGIMGTMAGFLTGQPMGMAMSLGAAMGRAQSPASQAASMAESQATGAQNSTGSDPDNYTGLKHQELIAKFGTPAAGSQSGANTTATPPPGFTLNPAGQIVPLPGMQQGDNRAAWKDPVENLLYDYIWRGPSGRGW